MSLRESLDRTLLLMRDDLSDAATDDHLLEALKETKVCIVADETNIRSHSAQSAFVTTALLAGRSGHEVYLDAPRTILSGRQPPLHAGDLLEQLQIVGKDLLPRCQFKVGAPKHSDVTILLGDTPWHGTSSNIWRIRANAWAARISQYNQRAWPDEPWPIGGMAAAALAAAEIFKSSMRKLAGYARDLTWFGELYSPIPFVGIDLGPFDPAKISNLRTIDFVSAGAITNCALYTLLRLPGVSAKARIIDDDRPSLDNMNRCMLFTRSRLKKSKAVELAKYQTKDFLITPVTKSYGPSTAKDIGPLAGAVLVGVDDIPSRWEVQKAWPKWLGVGATSHYSAMASYHTPHLACAGCLHPTDDPTHNPIPTVSFVSFWAGLWLSSLYLRYLANDRLLQRDQHFFFSPLKPDPDTLWHTSVAPRPDCPVGCARSKNALTA